jgi:eukaryotic-like serine/threonine-protein kinase
MHAVMGTGRLIAGRYRLQEPIGRGAMGIVWRGRDELLDRDVAVKEVQITSQASLADAEILYQRTLREARTAARLSHPSVVKVFDVVEEGGTPWIVMELVEARSLDQVIAEDGPLPPEQAAGLGTSLVSALADAHSAGVLHRDVKPSNVLVTKDGRAVLTDFGIATFAEDLGLTQAGMVVGTPGFTAPERIRGDVATPASDLWSLGATLYAAVEGRGPFERVGGSSVISAGVATEDAPRAPSAGPLGPVIDALLSRDPGTRPDATTAARLLADAATAARTGPRPLRDDRLSEASYEPATEEAAKSGPGHMSDADSGFLDPPDYKMLQIPDSPHPGDDGTRAGELAGAGEGLTALAVTAAASSGAAAAGPGAAAPGGSTAAAAAGTAAAGAGTSTAGAAGAYGAGPIQLADAGGAAADGKAVMAAAAPGLVLASGSDLDPSRGRALWGPVKPPASSAKPGPEAARPSGPSGPGAGGAGGGGGGGGGGGAGGNGMWDAARRAWNSPGRWRLIVAATGIAAIIVAAIIGWNIFQHSGPGSALGTTLPAGAPGQTSGSGGDGSGGKNGGHHSGSANPSSGGTSGTHGGTPAGSGHGKPGSPSTGPSGTASGHPSPSSTPSGSSSPSPSASPTPSPTPSTSPTPPVLPSGWKWHTFSADLMDTVAGFKVGMPDAWTQSVSGEVAHLTQSARDFHLGVNLNYWVYVRPLREAQYLETLAANAHPNDYRVLLLSSVGFKTLGGYRSASAAELKYSWYNASQGTYYTQLDVLVTLSTSAGSQPYTFTLWAPSGTFGSARGIFGTALPTFRALPS